MIVPIKRILLEAKEFNVGPSLGQKFMEKVNSHINNEKSKIKDKLLELKLRERAIGASSKQPELEESKKLEEKPKPVFNSSKINPRDKNNPYEKYI